MQSRFRPPRTDCCRSASPFRSIFLGYILRRARLPAGFAPVRQQPAALAMKPHAANGDGRARVRAAHAKVMIPVALRFWNIAAP